MGLKVNNIFYTLQGEGYHTGTPSIFIRLSDCNLRCSFCDTEFLSGETMDEKDIILECQRYEGKHIVLTGGEPGAQDISKLVYELRKVRYYVQIETNGMFALPWQIDWVTCSPKTKPESLNIEFYHELKLVIGMGGKIPLLGDHADRYNFPLKKELCWISPVNPLSHNEKIGVATSDDIACNTLNHCVELVKDNPVWRLSTQLHKYWRIP
mgnify:CR=1 FL=1